MLNEDDKISCKVSLNNHVNKPLNLWIYNLLKLTGHCFNQWYNKCCRFAMVLILVFWHISILLTSWYVVELIRLFLTQCIAMVLIGCFFTLVIHKIMTWYWFFFFFLSYQWFTFDAIYLIILSFDISVIHGMFLSDDMEMYHSRDGFCQCQPFWINCLLF